MSDAAIWWEPKGADTPRRISLGLPLVDLQVQPWQSVRSSVTLSGRRSITRLSGGYRLRVESAPITDYDIADELEEMASYLRAGGLISLAEDKTAAWASYASSASGYTVTLDGAPWQAYSSGTPTAGERLALHGPSPRNRPEWHEVDTSISIPGSIYGGIATVSPIRADWSDDTHILVRQYGFWPVLRMPESAMSAQVLRHKHRRYWTLEMTLETDEHAIAAIGEDPSVVFNGPTDVGNPTMTQYLRSIGGV